MFAYNAVMFANNNENVRLYRCKFLFAVTVLIMILLRKVRKNVFEAKDSSLGVQIFRLTTNFKCCIDFTL